MNNQLRDYMELLRGNPNLIENEKALIKIILNEEKIQSWVEENKKILLASGKPEEWAEIGIVYNDPYIIILRDLVEFPSGRIGSYFRAINQADLRGGQGVVVLANMNDKYLLLHQYRHPTRFWSYEVPRGFGEPGVLAEAQARIEIKEEVGGEIAEIYDLGVYFNNTGFEGNEVKLFYAKLQSIGNLAIDEGIESIHWVTLVQLEKMIANGDIVDGFTIAAYTKAKLNGFLH